MISNIDLESFELKMRGRMVDRLRAKIILSRLALAALITVLLSSCGLRTEKPPINPDPSDEIIIYGSLPEDKALDVQMTARFESTSRLCGNYIDISHVYQLSETLTIDVEKTANRYQARFFRDAIMQGDCDWSLIYVSAKLVHKEAGTAWRKLYNASPKDLATKHLASVLHNEEDYSYKIECDVKPKTHLDVDSETAIEQELVCSRQGMFLMPDIHRYNVNYDYIGSGLDRLFFE